MSNVLYKVNCGRSGNVQIILCDRLRKCKSQVLVDEETVVETRAELDSLQPLDREHIFDNREFEVDFPPEKRVRHKPVWMKDGRKIMFCLFTGLCQT